MKWMLIVAIVLAAIGGLGERAEAGPSDPVAPDLAWGPADQARPAPACSQALGDRRWPELGPQLEIDEADVGPAGTSGRPRLCVVYFPREDVCNIVLSGATAIDQSRAAKTEALGRAIATTAADFGWRPEPPLLILVLTNQDAAAEAYARYRPNFENQQEAEFVGRRDGPRAWSGASAQTTSMAT